MHKVTRQVCKAFLDGRSYRNGNSRTDGNSLYLHGHEIAYHCKSGAIKMTLAGRPTVAMRERLNGLCELFNGTRPFCQHKGEQFFDGQPIDSNQWVAMYWASPELRQMHSTI